jgi:hypothetical protein
MKTYQTIIRLTVFAMLGFAHWFFGNLYEAVVLSPNALFAHSQAAALENIRELFRISAPYYYFLPWSPLSILLVIFLYAKVHRTAHRSLRRWAGTAALLASAVGGLTYYIITRFNLVLWVGTARVSEAELHPMILLNVGLGNLRVVLQAAVLYCLYRCLRIAIGCTMRGQL